MSITLITAMIIVALLALFVGFFMGAGSNNRRYDKESDRAYAELRAEMDRQSEEATRGVAHE